MFKNGSIWRNKDYAILWGGQTISSLGSNISSIVYPLLILALTNSPAQAGIGAALAILPTVIFGLPAGVLVDRWNRKKLMIFCDLGRALIMASIPIAAYFGFLSIYQLYVSAFLEGTLAVFFTLSGIAAIPRIVEKDQLTEAISRNNVGDSTAQIIGPAIGGVIYQSLGRTIPYVFDSISYVASAISLLFIKTRFQIDRDVPRGKIHLEIRQGVSWLWHHKIVRFLAFLTGGGAIFGAGQTLLIILIAKKIGLGAATIGIIFSVASVGALFGSLISSTIQKRFGVRRVLVTIRWIQFLTWPFYFVIHGPILLAIITGIFYVLNPIYGVVLASYRTSLIPDELQGRVTSVYRIIMFSGASLGSLLVGFLSQALGLNTTLVIEVAIILSLAVLATINKDLRGAN